jgi:hypothetical protein
MPRHWQGRDGDGQAQAPACLIMTARGLHITSVWYSTFMFDFVYIILLQ